ncbi:MAG: LysR family transcriptional regulator [Bacteroidia bacterium]|nr:LysR family transcriptional regulator [Bacteroidia bacterium]MCZ2249142.1 LysR family transcriptional regulator [Bacteroidia bacterium]
MPNKKYTIRVRIWIDEEQGPFLGIGRVILLERIKETGSITNAAKSIKMSYRQAWQLVEDMNKRAVMPLVEKIHGGKNGSGAVLTKAGEKAIKEFYKLEEKINRVISRSSYRISI